jgi:hypothetical protein
MTIRPEFSDILALYFSQDNLLEPDALVVAQLRLADKFYKVSLDIA